MVSPHTAASVASLTGRMGGAPSEQRRLSLDGHRHLHRGYSVLTYNAKHIPRSSVHPSKQWLGRTCAAAYVQGSRQAAPQLIRIRKSAPRLPYANLRLCLTLSGRRTGGSTPSLLLTNVDDVVQGWLAALAISGQV